MTALSGGQAARVGLAALLLSRYDVYLLDEPTNDLDVDGLDLLEEFVDGLDAPVVVVSHDREFLARTVTTVVEIDRSLQRITTYGGGYEAYLDERSVARRQARLGLRGLRRTPRRARGPRAHAAGVDGEGRQERPPQGEGQRQDRPQVPRRSRPRSRPPRRARPSGSSSGSTSSRSRARSGSCSSPSRPPRDRATSSRSRAPRRVQPRRLRPRPGRPAARPARPRRRHRAQRRRQVARCWPCCSAASRPDGGQVSIGSGVVVGEVDQARALFEGDEPLVDAFSRAGARLADGRGAHPAGQVRPRRRTRSTRPAVRRCHPASARGPPWPCCRRAA